MQTTEIRRLQDNLKTPLITESPFQLKHSMILRPLYTFYFNSLGIFMNANFLV